MLKRIAQGLHPILYLCAMIVFGGGALLLVYMQFRADQIAAQLQRHHSAAGEIAREISNNLTDLVFIRSYNIIGDKADERQSALTDDIDQFSDRRAAIATLERILSAGLDEMKDLIAQRTKSDTGDDSQPDQSPPVSPSRTDQDPAPDAPETETLISYARADAETAQTAAVRAQGALEDVDWPADIGPWLTGIDAMIADMPERPGRTDWSGADILTAFRQLLIDTDRAVRSPTETLLDWSVTAGEGAARASIDRDRLSQELTVRGFLKRSVIWDAFTAVQTAARLVEARDRSLATVRVRETALDDLLTERAAALTREAQLAQLRTAVSETEQDLEALRSEAEAIDAAVAERKADRDEIASQGDQPANFFFDEGRFENFLNQVRQRHSFENIERIEIDAAAVPNGAPSDLGTKIKGRCQHVIARSQDISGISSDPMICVARYQTGWRAYTFRDLSGLNGAAPEEESTQTIMALSIPLSDLAVQEGTAQLDHVVLLSPEGPALYPTGPRPDLVFTDRQLGDRLRSKIASHHGLSAETGPASDTTGAPGQPGLDPETLRQALKAAGVQTDEAAAQSAATAAGGIFGLARVDFAGHPVVTLDGKQYLMFVRRLTTPFSIHAQCDAGTSANGSSGASTCALVAGDRVDPVWYVVGLRERTGIVNVVMLPTAAQLTAFIVFLFVLVVVWFLIKVRSLGQFVAIRPSDLVGVAFSCLLGVALLTLLFLSAFNSLSASHLLNRTASAIARDIGTNLRTELRHTVALLNATYENGYGRACQPDGTQAGAPVRPLACGAADPLAADPLAADPLACATTRYSHLLPVPIAARHGLNAQTVREEVRCEDVQDQSGASERPMDLVNPAFWLRGLYPPHSQSFLLNEDGNIVRTAITHHPIELPRLPLKDRDYYRQPAQDRGWRFDGETIYLERIRSRDFGRKLTAVSLDIGRSERAGPEGRIAVAIKRMSSLWHPILPPGYGFAILDTDRLEVLYHSDDRRSLVEDFFRQTGDNTRLKDAVLSGLPRDGIEARYRGIKRSFAVEPVVPDGRLPLSVVVFYDRELAGYWQSEIFLTAFFTTLINILGLVTATWFLAPRLTKGARSLNEAWYPLFPERIRPLKRSIVWGTPIAAAILAYAIAAGTSGLPQLIAVIMVQGCAVGFIWTLFHLPYAEASADPLTRVRMRPISYTIAQAAGGISRVVLLGCRLAGRPQSERDLKAATRLMARVIAPVAFVCVILIGFFAAFSQGLHMAHLWSLVVLAAFLILAVVAIPLIQINAYRSRDFMRYKQRRVLPVRMAVVSLLSALPALVYFEDAKSFQLLRIQLLAADEAVHGMERRCAAFTDDAWSMIPARFKDTTFQGMGAVVREDLRRLCGREGAIAWQHADIGAGGGWRFASLWDHSVLPRPVPDRPTAPLIAGPFPDDLQPVWDRGRNPLLPEFSFQDPASPSPGWRCNRPGEIDTLALPFFSAVLMDLVPFLTGDTSDHRQLLRDRIHVVDEQVVGLTICAVPAEPDLFPVAEQPVVRAGPAMTFRHFNGMIAWTGWTFTWPDAKLLTPFGFLSEPWHSLIRALFGFAVVATALWLWLRGVRWLTQFPFSLFAHKPQTLRMAGDHRRRDLRLEPWPFARINLDGAPADLSVESSRRHVSLSSIIECTTVSDLNLVLDTFEAVNANKRRTIFRLSDLDTLDDCRDRIISSNSTKHFVITGFEKLFLKRETRLKLLDALERIVWFRQERIHLVSTLPIENLIEHWDHYPGLDNVDDSDNDDEKLAAQRKLSEKDIEPDEPEQLRWQQVFVVFRDRYIQNRYAEDTPPESDAAIAAWPECRAAWNSLDKGERLVLHHLAEGNLVSGENNRALDRLIARGFVEWETYPRFRNTTFERFARSDAAESQRTFARWENDVPDGGWTLIRVPLTLAVFVMIGLIVFQVGELSNETIGLLSALFGTIPIVLGFLGGPGTDKRLRARTIKQRK